MRARLLSQPAAPNILAFGIGDADPAVVGEIATQPDFGWPTVAWTPVRRSPEFLTSLTQSVISSGNAVASESATLQFDKPEGFTLAVDIV